MDQEIKYKVWRDRGGNIGIQCLVDNRVHWTGNEPTHDPQNPGVECSNCLRIKNSNLRNEQAIAHNVEVADFEKEERRVKEKNKLEKDERKKDKVPHIKDFCKHPMSQPIELR